MPVNGIEVRFTIQGDAEIINPGSLGISEAGIASALVRIGELPGEIAIKGESTSINSSSISFKSFK